MIQVVKTNGLFDLRAVYAILRASEDGLYAITIKRVRKSRTSDQNGWLWGCVYPILLEGLIDAGWEFTSIEQVHEFFKAQLTRDKAINYHTGEIVEFPTSTAIMDTVTFMCYTDKLREYASEYLNIEIPNPDKNWRHNEKK